MVLAMPLDGFFARADGVKQVCVLSDGIIGVKTNNS
jgi:hypothetical protein